MSLTGQLPYLLLKIGVEEVVEGLIGGFRHVGGGKEGGKQGRGAIVGAVMKATRGQADAAKVRALLLERLGVSE